MLVSLLAPLLLALIKLSVLSNLFFFHPSTREKKRGYIFFFWVCNVSLLVMFLLLFLKDLEGICIYLRLLTFLLFAFFTRLLLTFVLFFCFIYWQLYLDPDRRGMHLSHRILGAACNYYLVHYCQRSNNFQPSTCINIYIT